MLSIIVAKAKNNVIGKENKLIWHIPDDLKRFKKLTTGKNIIMGRKTFESLGGILPNRFHIVLTKDSKFKIDNENVKIINDIADLEKYINDDEENFVIGGESIYKLLLPSAKKLYITQLDVDFEGDTYFPEIDEKEWEIVEKQKGPQDKNNFKYEYTTYEWKH